MIQKSVFRDGDIVLQYLEIRNDRQPLVLLHAQGVDAWSFRKCFRVLSRKYHVFAVDCYGHGGSLHDPEKYDLHAIGSAVAAWIRQVVGRKVFLLGHSSGGLIAAHVAAETDLCEKLILEDPPFFACQGERRLHTFNYVDLSTHCHQFLAQEESRDFVLYYFAHQYAWNYFPDKSREQVRSRLVPMAARYRQKHPDKNLRVPFWPKAALAGYEGMNNYDPRFGERFYDDSFHAGIDHEAMLKKIRCDTVFMKARTETSADSILLAALNEEDLRHVVDCIPQCQVVRFDCGHGIHIEKRKAFIDCLLRLAD